MRLQHLALEVRDQQRAIDFYTRFFRFDPATARGTPTVSSSSTTLTASRSRSRPPTRGSEVPGARTSGSRWIRDEVRGLRERLVADGIELVKDEETEGYVGYQVPRPRPARSRGRPGPEPSSIWAAGGAALGRIVDDERMRRVVSVALAALLVASVALLWI